MTTAQPSGHWHHNGEFDAYIQRINDRFNSLTGPIFETDATKLYETYLSTFDNPAQRQYHTCSCCRQFIERFGSLATVNDVGLVVSALWDGTDAPDHYKPAVDAMQRLVQRAKLTVPFLSSEKMYGTPVTGIWKHFAVKPAAERIYRATALKNAFQAACEKREEFASVRLALDEYTQTAVFTALQLLKNDALQNSEAVMGQAQFLADLHAARDSVGGMQRKDNLAYRMVALAPSGYCHPRSSMIATLLDDIVAGKSYDHAMAAWAKKMHPLQYQRPQAAPTAGAIKAAELAFGKLDAASALERRYATMADILEDEWRPRAAMPESKEGTIFGGIKPKGEAPRAVSMKVPPAIMTVEKFRRTVLPTADMIELYTGFTPESFVALTTAVHADARPIMQWDSEERRNPVAWYLYHGGSMAPQFNLSAGQYQRVAAITPQPPMWFGGDFPHHGAGLVFLLHGAKDMRVSSNAAIFPSFLKSEFRPYAATIEAFSKSSRVQDMGGEHACGLLVSKGAPCNVQLRVSSAGQMTEYSLDRWD